MEFLNNLVEKLKASASAQQESKLFIAIREKYDELPPVGQKIALVSSVVLGGLLIIAMPASYIMDAASLSSEFEERRGAIKALLQSQKDSATAPQVASGPPASTLKGQFDAQIAGFGAKPEQIKEAIEVPYDEVPKVAASALKYRIEKLTIRQVIDIGYAIEQGNEAVKLMAFDVKAVATDPHYYDLTFKVVSFSPKAAPALPPPADNKKKAPGKAGS